MAAPEYVALLRTMARESGIADEVWWSGRLEATEVSRVLQAADVFVLPQPDGHLTRSGGFMAAAAHGLPVIAVRDPEGRDQEEFIHGENIWLVERSAPEEIAAALDGLLGDRAAARRIGCNLHRLYEARFAWTVTVVRPLPAGTSPAPLSPPSVSAQNENTVTAAHAAGTKP